MELPVQKQCAENKNLVYSKIYRQHLIVELGLYSYLRKGSYLELSNFFLRQYRQCTKQKMYAISTLYKEWVNSTSLD